MYVQTPQTHLQKILILKTLIIKSRTNQKDEENGQEENDRQESNPLWYRSKTSPNQTNTPIYPSDISLKQNVYIKALKRFLYFSSV